MHGVPWTVDGHRARPQREAWTLTVNEMIGLGAQVTDDQAAAIVQSLSRTFPAKQ